MADSRIDCHDVGLQLWHFFNHGKPELMREMIPVTPPNWYQTSCCFSWIHVAESCWILAIYWAHIKTFRQKLFGDLGEVIANMAVKSRSLLVVPGCPDNRQIRYGKQWDLQELKLQQSWHVMATVMAMPGYFGRTEPHRLPLLNWHLLPMPSGSHTMSHLDWENGPTGPSSKKQGFADDQNKCSIFYFSLNSFISLKHDQLWGCSDHVCFRHRVAGETHQATGPRRLPNGWKLQMHSSPFPKGAVVPGSRSRIFRNFWKTLSGGSFWTPQGLVVSTCFNPFSKHVPSLG